MKLLLAKLGIAVALALATNVAYAGVVLDRVVASIENAPILQSDWDKAVAFEALQQCRTISSYTGEQRRAVLERLVDQQLLRQQMGDENIAAAEDREITKEIDQIRSACSEPKTADAWRALLAQYGLNESELRERVSRQLQVMRFVDLRLRPEAHVQRADVESYYNDTLVPEIEKRGGKPESLAAVYPRIEAILQQQRIDSLLTGWLQDLRDHTEIHWVEMKPGTGEPSIDNSEGH
jgi:hypothetical protein